MSLNTLSLKDQEFFLKHGQGPSISPPFTLIHKAFESRADSQPHDLAIECCGASITYSQLDEEANALAARLISDGLQPRQRVCIVIQRSIHMIVAILAVLKCGCQYVPLDGGVVPEQSLSYIVSDTAVSTVICLKKFVHKLQHAISHQVSLLVVDEQPSNEKSRARPNIDITPHDGAYIIYTSGTTGKPKGVDVSHENVTNLLCLAPGNLGIQKGTLVPQLLSISFDMAQWEILGTLLNGGTLLIRGSNWKDVLQKAHTIIATPSILGTLKRVDYPNIQVAALAGEPCPVSLVDEWAQDCALYNCCGPTEVTIVNTMNRQLPGRTISIGRPVPNTSVYILDNEENPVPRGAPGVMWAGGSCVTRGYLNLPEVTSSKYKLDKFRGDGSLMFNTGDRVRWLEDGTIENLGRVDDQVKIKGFRVELGSIAASIESIHGVDKACVIYNNSVLWGFYSASSKFEDSQLSTVVAALQPYYAVPSRWEYRAVIPLTNNGKVDKRSLLESVINVNKTTITKPVTALIKTEKQVFEIITEASSSSESDDESKYELTVPPKKGTHGLRSLRFRIFDLYRRFFSIVFLGNLAAVFAYVRFPSEGNERLANLGTAVAANLTVAVLIRQEYVVNALFNICCGVPVSLPLWFRKHCARVYHIGGIHSGCAIAATIWLVIFSIAATIWHSSLVTQVVSYLILGLMLAIVISAYPTFRQRLHNKFEVIHRFAGWTVLGLFWIQAIFVCRDLGGNLKDTLLKSPVIWLLVVVTISIILPWLRLRRITVRPETLSSHATRLYFDYCTPVVGTAVRVSTRPLIEWHAFATIAEPNKKGFSLIVSNAGDWTDQQIRAAPTKLWVRGIPACGIIRIVPLFRSVVLVATGSGIGPCLPAIYEKRVPMRIVWSTKNPVQTFGQGIIDSIKDTDPNAVIHDTRTQGRPDIVAISYRLYKESGAEAVIVISNQKVTQLLVYGMESRGIPAYGAIFDS
ncbi:nonribosomal peptide synthetase 12 [Bisporella sp. PMI_857]|nr:nonribosomal peptide synthetase 12 [Bisporella sp. PMI_857]